MADTLKDLKILHRERLPVRDFFIRYGKDLQLVQHCPDEENMGKAVDVTLERIKVQLKKANDKQNDHRSQPVSELT